MNGREPSSTAIQTPEPITGRVTSEKLNSALSRYDEGFRVFSGMMAEQRKLSEKIYALESQVDFFKQDQKDSAFRMIEVVGIFTALLGFIVFEAQIFKTTQTTLTLVGLTSVMLGALTFFVLLLDLAFDGFKKIRNLRYFLAFFAVICIISGFWAASEGYKNGDYKIYPTKDEVDKSITTEIDKRINNSQNVATTTTIIHKDDTELLEFKNCILKNGLGRCL